MTLRHIAIALLCVVAAGCTAKPPSTKGNSFHDIKKTLIKGENVVISGQEFSDDIDFTEIIAGIEESTKHFRCWIPGGISFFNCTFKGKVLGYKSGDGISTSVTFEKNLTFNNCSFQESVDFRESNVTGLVDFSGSIFYKTSTFEGFSCNNNDVRFAETVFKDEAKFQRSQFNGNVNFMRAIFENHAYFQNATFGGFAQFGACVFSKYTDFINLKAKGDIFFNYTEFKDKFLMNNSTIDGRAEFIEAKFGKINEIKKTIFLGITRFEKADLKGSLDLSGSAFYYAKPATQGMIKSEESKIILEETYFQSGELILLNDF
ncbi:MAG: pentapeptide repeat-containing protein [Bacteroidetes bacterium]|nr:pentapeptide repeat-containing protein [Bacteroidota bacterium]